MVTATSFTDLCALQRLREQELQEARIIPSSMFPSRPLQEFDISISHEFHSPKLQEIPSITFALATAPLDCM